MVETLVTKSPSIVEQFLPVGSYWRRVKGKHSGRTVRITSVSNRGVKIELVGKRYALRQSTGSGQYMAQVPFDMFVTLYVPEDVSMALPSKEHIHAHHIETQLPCNCPSDIRTKALILVPHAPIIIRKVEPLVKEIKAPIVMQEATPDKVTEFKQEWRFKRSQPKSDDPRSRLKTIAEEQELMAMYVDRTDLTSETICKNFGVSNGTLYRLTQMYGIPTRTKAMSPEARANISRGLAKARAQKNRSTTYEVVAAPSANGQEPITESLQKQGLETVIVEPKVGVSAQTLRDSFEASTKPFLQPQTTSKWKVTIIREVVEVVDAASMLDALAQFDGKKGVEVVTIDKVRQ